MKISSKIIRNFVKANCLNNVNSRLNKANMWNYTIGKMVTKIRVLMSKTGTKI